MDEDRGSILGLPPPSEEGDEGTALLSQRVTAGLIDVLACAILGFIAWSFTLWSYWPSWLIAPIVFLFRDALPNGQSPGKRLLKIRTIDTVTLLPCGLAQSLRRNLPWILVITWPVEIILLGMSEKAKRLGDWLANTEVRRISQPVYMENISDEALISRAAPIVSAQEPKPVINEPASPPPPPPPRPREDSGIPKRVPSPQEALGVSENAAEEEIETAYWEFVDRYSDDAARDISTAELNERCKELDVRFSAFDLTLAGMDVGYRPGMTDQQMKELIHGHFIIINRARDALLG
ncbi:MAG TPA: RDD family protein [Candidatus Brocadiia bacterium]|nr:RDD family protein [Candidatus Brocadiia bacterium]